MEISVTSSLVRWRALLSALSVMACAASPAQAQLRFAGPANGELVAESPLEAGVSTAQFQPVEPPAGGLDMAPIVPPPSSEAAALPAADAPPTPPASGGAPATSVSAPAPAPLSASEWSSPPSSLGTGSDFINTDPMGIAPEVSSAFDNAYGDQYIDGAPETYSTRNWFRRGRWYSTADVTVWLRGNVHNFVFSADQGRQGGSGGMGTKTVAPTFVPGTRLTIGRFLGQDVNDQDHMIEFGFFGLFTYRDTASLATTTQGSILTSLTPGNIFQTTENICGMNILNPTSTTQGVSFTSGFDRADRHDLLYESDLNSYELNYRIISRPTRDHLALQPNGNWVRHEAASRIKSLILGTRALSVNELMQLRSVAPDLTGDTPLTDALHGVHRVRTTNSMYGFQIGTEVLESREFWTFGLRAKGGALFNFAHRDLSTLVDAQGVTTRDDHQKLSKDNLAGFVEAGFAGTYQIRTNCNLRGGYDFMYVTGIATAPQNAGLQPGFPMFEVTGDAFYHGPSFGLEMLW